MNASADSADEQDGLPTPRRYVAICALIAAIVLAVLDGSIANIALPTIADDFRISAAESIWVVSAYQLALVVSVLPFAALGESRGYRLVFAVGVVAFTLASALCALSGSIGLLVAARVVQGFGASAIMSVLAALLRYIYPQRMIGRAIGINALFVSLSSAAGPTLGATILSVASWHWLFLVNVPIGIGVLAAARALPRVKTVARRIDLVSVVLNGLFFGLLVLGVDGFGRAPKTSLGMIAVSVVALVLLVRREAPQAAPLIPLDLLRNRPIRLASIASVCAFCAQMSAFVALPFYLQGQLGQSQFATGLLMTSWPLAAALVSPFAGSLADQRPPAVLCAIGGSFLGLGLALSAFWPLANSVAPLVVFNAICGLGFGFFQGPNNRTLLASAPKNRSGAAGGLQATARQFGLTSGSALVAVFFSVTPLSAPSISLTVGAVLAGVAASVSLWRAQDR